MTAKILLAANLAALTVSLSAAAVELRHVMPQGEAKQVRQVSVNFDAPVKALGDLTGPAPVSWDCSGTTLKGQGRWVDTQTWTLDFTQTLPAGVRCEFKPVANFKDLASKPVKANPVYRFHTGGPNLERIETSHGRQGIDEDAVFLVHATGPIDFSTVEAHAWCTVEGLGEKLPVKLLPAADKQALFKKNEHWRNNAERIAVFRCGRQFPNGAEVKVYWDVGIKGSTGLATSTIEHQTFRVRPEFKVTVHCERENAKTDCVPLTPILLRFAAPVRRDDVTKLKLLGPNGKKWSATVADDDYQTDFVDYVQFIGPFPPEAQFTLQVPPQIRDDADRPLTNRDRLAKVELKTAAYPPLLKFAADFGIVEHRAGGLLPVTVRNLDPKPDATPLTTADGSKPGTAAKLRLLRLTKDEEVIDWWRRSAKSAYHRDVGYLAAEPQAKTLLLPKPNGPRPMEVVGIPLGSPGYYVVEAESQRLGDSLIDKGGPMYVRTGALNTNLSVHFKKSDENQLVWVTTLDGGKPVADARVSIRGCDGKQLAFGKTGADGTMAVKRRLPEIRKCADGLWGYFVSARATRDGVEDFSFVLQDWQQGIEPWRFRLPYPGIVPDVITHTVFDRPLLRTGETVHMKHFARRHTTAGFAFAQRPQLPDKAVIQLEGSDLRYELPLTWKNGVADSAWAIPAEAKLGRYWVSFIRAGEKAERVYGGDSEGEGDEEGWAPPGRYWRGGSFRVGEFRLPVLKGEVIGSAKPVVGAKDLSVDLRLAYLAGGAAGAEKVRLRSEIRPLYVKPPLGFESYLFGTEPVNIAGLKEGQPSEQPPTAAVFDDQRDLALDKAGTRRVLIPKLPQWRTPAEVFTEMEYSDPSGEVHTAAGNTRWFPAAVLAGIATEGWASPNERTEVKLATLDTTLKPLPGARYAVHAWHQRTLVHRKRMIGGFYSYDTRYETDDLGEICKGQSDAKGLAQCEVKAPKLAKGAQAGQVILEMKAIDADGRTSYAQSGIWFGQEGDGDGWFEQQNSDRIDVLPERRNYEPGETAVFQVRMPFRQATALVSVEREGVIDRFVTTLSGSKPTVSLPIKANYGPNVFVSVFVVRGRVGDVQPTALVDLGKPAYKLGIAEIAVGRKGYELTVKVEPAKAVYRTRDEALVKVRVTRPDGSPAKGGEFVLAAVDEALLELARNDSWQLLSRVMARRGYAVQTSTAQAQIIGKRHFGLKALPAGGGGGRQQTRELFDTLIKWDARVVLDDQGEATVKLPLNDSLTSVRIVAIAHQGANLFGTGFASIRTTKEVQLFSGLPPLVRDADQFRAGFTVRNLTTRSDNFTVSATASALVRGSAAPLPPLTAQSFTLAPGDAKEFSWPLSVPAEASRIDWRAEAKAESGGGQDALKLSQKVLSAVPIRVQAATLEHLSGPLSIPVKRPADALSDRGSIDVSVKAKLGASSDSVKAWMETYPYLCLEQRVSKAISTGDLQRWDEIGPRLGSYLDDRGLAAYFPNPRPGYGSPVLTAYLLAAAHEGGYTVPDAVLSRMLDALAAFVEGRITLDARIHWSPRQDLPMRKLQAIEALARYNRATPQQLATVPITPGLWPLGSVVDWVNILARMPTLPNRAKQLAEAETILRTRMVKSGTLTQFNNERDDYWWWMMVSPDGTAARAISALMELPAWQSEIPRLVRGIVSRKQEGHWNTTPANVWGVLMLDKFARKYEPDPVAGNTRIAVSDSATPAQTLDWSRVPAEEAQRAVAVAAGKKAVPPAGSAWRDPGDSFRFAWPAGGTANVSVQQEGTGKPWVTIQTRAARRLTAPVYAGFEVKKTVKALEQKIAGRWSKGDVVQVSIEVNAPSVWTWVVVDDPVPAGSTILGSGLGRESQLARGDNTASGYEYGYGYPAFVERAFDGYRAYYEFLPKGKLQFSYSFRLNNAGDFKLPPTRVEAMYAPENFGEVPNQGWKVE